MLMYNLYEHLKGGGYELRAENLTDWIEAAGKANDAGLEDWFCFVKDTETGIMYELDAAEINAIEDLKAALERTEKKAQEIKSQMLYYEALPF